jgi:hypothetical protein
MEGPTRAAARSSSNLSARDVRRKSMSGKELATAVCGRRNQEWIPNSSALGLLYSVSGSRKTLSRIPKPGGDNMEKRGESRTH